MRNIGIRNLSKCKKRHKLITMREINIFISNICAGTLIEQSKHEYIFRYNDNYFYNSALPPVSLTLPKTQQEYISQYIFPVFTNLLPEGANRKVFCRLLMIDEKDFFGILAATENIDMIGDITIKRKVE